MSSQTSDHPTPACPSKEEHVFPGRLIHHTVPTQSTDEQATNDSHRCWTDVWAEHIDNTWFQDQLDTCSRGVLYRAKLPSGWASDVRQQAIILFARCLERDVTLGFKAERGCREAFLKTIIHRCCLKSLRQFRRTISEKTMTEKSEILLTHNPVDSLEERLDLRRSVEQLPEPFRMTITLVLEGESAQEISDLFQTSRRTVYRRIEHATKILRARMCDK